MPSPENSSEPTRRRRLQFSLGSMLILMAVASVLCGVLAGMLRGSTGPIKLDARIFIVLAAALPVALVIIVSALRWLAGRWQGRG